MLVHPVHGYLSPLSVQLDHECICRCIIRIYESGAIEALTVKNRMSLVLYCCRLAFNKACSALFAGSISTSEAKQESSVQFSVRTFCLFDRVGAIL